MNQFHLDIITPDRKAFSEIVDEVLVPTPGGIIGVLAKHEPLFTSLSEGEVKITQGSKEFFLAIGGGFMEVRPDGMITILVSRAYHANELNEAELKKALESAKALIARKVTGDELVHALSTIRRSTLELKVARRRRPTPYSSQN
jgi:F-type H+-transporting ATPase subunit epsilon